MRPIAHHVMLRLKDDRVIAPSRAARLLLTRTVLRLCAELRLLSFRAADTHIHLLIACLAEEIGRLSQRLGASLRRGLGIEASFQPARIKPISSQAHLVNTFFYVLRQEERHGLQGDGLHEASNLPDLLGARVNGRYTIEHVKEMLPRVKRGELLELLGGDLCAPITDHTCLAEAAAAAIGHPSLSGRAPLVVEARRAAVHVAKGALPIPRIAELLGIGLRTVKRLRTQPADGALLTAVTRQLQLRQPAATTQPEAGAVEHAALWQEGSVPTGVVP